MIPFMAMMPAKDRGVLAVSGWIATLVVGAVTFLAWQEVVAAEAVTAILGATIAIPTGLLGIRNSTRSGPTV